MEKETKALIFDVQRGSAVDGPGVRTAVFFKGCNLRCTWCHNPESQSLATELMVWKQKCVGCGKCKARCPHALASCDACGKCTLPCPADARRIAGKEQSVSQIMETVLRDRPYYGTEGGVTFSGGECMLQIDALEALLTECHAHGIQTAVDTAGHVPWESFERILPVTDLFLYDVKCADGALHRRVTGVDNRRILENLARLSSRARVLVRIPVIPTVNATEAEMRAIAALLAPLPLVGVELLPYHRMGEAKYEAINRTPTVFDVPSADEMVRLRALFGK